VPSPRHHWVSRLRASGTGALASTQEGQAVPYDELRARVSIWPPLRLARLRCEREAVGVVVPTSVLNRAHTGRRAAEAIHRTGWEPFAEVAVLEDGRVHAAGRVPTTALALETFARTLRP